VRLFSALKSPISQTPFGFWPTDSFPIERILFLIIVSHLLFRLQEGFFYRPVSRLITGIVPVVLEACGSNMESGLLPDLEMEREYIWGRLMN